MKKVFLKNTLGAVKYCGQKNLKPVAVEVWDSRTRAMISRSENMKLFMQNNSSSLEVALNNLAFSQNEKN